MLGQQRSLDWLLAVLVALAWLNSCFNRLKVEFSRHLPRFARVGEPFKYRFTVTNLTDNSYFSPALGEQLAESFPDPAQINDFFRLDKRPWFKRLVSYRDWMVCLRHRRGGTIAEVGLPELSKTPVQISVSFTPSRRGAIVFANSYLAKPDGLGLFRRLIPLPTRHRCLVLPKHNPIDMRQNVAVFLDK